MINKNYRNGAEDVAKIAAKGFDMIGKEVVGGVGALREVLEKQDKFENKALDTMDGVIKTMDDVIKRQKLDDYGRGFVDFSLFDNMSPENKIVFFSALSLLVDADETRDTSVYFGIAVVRFRVQETINENARIEKLVAKLNADEAALLTRMICEMVAISNNNSAVLSVSEAIIDCLTISNKDKQRIKSEVGKFADSCGGAPVFIELLAKECSFITDETENEAADDDDSYDICKEFSDFSGGKKKFAEIDVVFTDRYKVSDTSIMFENCILVFESEFQKIVEMTGGSLEFVNCKFVTKQKPDDKAFTLQGTGVKLRGCTFDKWKAGLFLSMDGDNLSLEECSFLSCGCDLISAKHLTEVTIEKCHVKDHNGKVADLDLLKKDSSKNDPIKINDCYFEECDNFTSSLFHVFEDVRVEINNAAICFCSTKIISGSRDVIINNATIYRCSMKIVSGNKIEFKDCKRIENCYDDIVLDGYNEIKFLKCDIINYYGNIGKASQPCSHIIIEDCKMDHGMGSIFAQRLDISSTVFKNCSPGDRIYDIDSLLVVNPTKENVSSSQISCNFIECYSDGALIAAFSKDEDKKVVNINNCHIIDCQCAKWYFVGFHFKIICEIIFTPITKSIPIIKNIPFIGEVKKLSSEIDGYEPFLTPNTITAFENTIEFNIKRPRDIEAELIRLKERIEKNNGSLDVDSVYNTKGYISISQYGVEGTYSVKPDSIEITIPFPSTNNGQKVIIDIFDEVSKETE